MIPFMRRNGLRALISLVLALTVPGCGGPVPTEPPFYVPRHPDVGSRPLGLGEGVLELRGKCLYVGPHLIIWPDDFSVVERDGVAVVEGAGWRIEPGDRIEFGGGSYEEASHLPSGGDVAARLPCPGPYSWISEIVDVIPQGD
jgi:hypothetical protein